MNRFLASDTQWHHINQETDISLETTILLKHFFFLLPGLLQMVATENKNNFKIREINANISKNHLKTQILNIQDNKSAPSHTHTHKRGRREGGGGGGGLVEEKQKQGKGKKLQIFITFLKIHILWRGHFKRYVRYAQAFIKFVSLKTVDNTAYCFCIQYDSFPTTWVDTVLKSKRDRWRWKLQSEESKLLRECNIFTK